MVPRDMTKSCWGAAPAKEKHTPSYQPWRSMCNMFPIWQHGMQIQLTHEKLLQLLAATLGKPHTPTGIEHRKHIKTYKSICNHWF